MATQGTVDQALGTAQGLLGPPLQSLVPARPLAGHPVEMMAPPCPGPGVWRGWAYILQEPLIQTTRASVQSRHSDNIRLFKETNMFIMLLAFLFLHIL